VSELADIFGEWFTPETVTVETYSDGGFEGPTYADPVPVANMIVEPVQKLVRAADGNERLSAAQLYVEPADAAKFTLHSRVTLSTGQHSVIQLGDFTSFGLLDHLVVTLE